MRLAVLAVAMAIVGGMAQAQEQAQAQGPGQGRAQAPGQVQGQAQGQAAPAAQQSSPTDGMLQALQAAPDGQSAAVLEDRIQQSWLRAGSPAVTLLIGKGLRLLQAGESEGAVEAFTDAITLQPDAAEAWHQRAIARYRAGDARGAVHDLEETLRLQPRDFSAFRTLADIAEARGDWKSAYAAWQKVMQLDPKTQGGEERLRELKRHAVGEET